MSEITLRPVTDSDAEKLFKLVGDCFSEHEGVFLERDGYDADLKAYATYMADAGGQAFVVDGDDEVLALVSYLQDEGGRSVLKRIYLSNKLRGSGAGLILLRHVENLARAGGATEMELWTDTRFKRAHSFYEREGYVRQSQTRHLGDISDTTEYCYVKGF
ncbi:MAG: hypothetical protein COB37_03225 [Kordiimonadales bacterium]|nr:MAG: hypothetical protein COB37_03225 [Kordiimonadales bacterium]